MAHPRAFERSRSLVHNPDKAKLALFVVGTTAVVGTIAWLLLRNRTTPPVRCPATPFVGTVQVGDYVVVQLQSADKTFSEPTWARVLRVDGSKLDVEISGETDELGEPKPLSTDKHGVKIGDRMTIARSCIYDRFRSDQPWTVLCGPALPAFVGPIDGKQASLLGYGDRAQVLVRGPTGETEKTWTLVGHVSAGQQVISGTVMSAPTANIGVKQGDVLSFLRDCVIDAEFGG